MTGERLIFDGRHMRATAFEVEGATKLVALFDHRRSEPGFPDVTPTGFFVRKGMSQIKVTVENSDFFLNPDLTAARRALNAYASFYGEVTGMGFSMGGFGCLAFARALRISRVLLVSPQRPKFPQGRLAGQVDLEAEAGFYTFPGGRLAGLPHRLRGTVLFDPWFNQGRDRSYARILGQLLPGLSLVAYPGGGHPATSLLARAGQYYRIQQAFVDPMASAARYRAIHRATREMDIRYLDRVADRLAAA